MKTLRWIALVLASLPLLLRGEELVRTAKLLAVNGSVSISLPSGAGSATVGADLPVGTVVTTSAGGQATIKFFDGTVAVVQPETAVSIQTHSVTAESGAVQKENTQLDLRSGGVIASLDPAKKNVTNFRVRTPKGIAAARGTVFAVRVNPGTSDASVTTMNGTVTLITDHGEITIAVGQVSSGSGALSVADAVKANPNLAKDIVDAAAMVATAVGNGSITNTAQSPSLVTTVLSAVVDVAIQAAPDTAPDIVKQVLTNAAPALQGSDGATVVSTVTESAQQAAAKADPAKADELAAAIAQASAEVVESTGIGSSTATNIVPPLDQSVVSPSKR